MTARTSILGDWRLKDENDLPDVLPWQEHERAYRPQMFVVLRRILVQGAYLTLVRLRVGAVEEVPFVELANTDDPRRVKRLYQPLLDDAIKERLIAIGAGVIGDAIAMPPGMDVIVVLKNNSAMPVKPRVAILVEEETPR